MLDPTLLAARPTNKVIFQAFCVPPSGARIWGDVVIVDWPTDDGYWCLEFREADCSVVLVAEKSVTQSCEGYVSIIKLPLGHVSTVAEVVAIYELFSQKKWPGNE